MPWSRVVGDKVYDVRYVKRTHVDCPAYLIVMECTKDDKFNLGEVWKLNDWSGWDAIPYGVPYASIRGFKSRRTAVDYLLKCDTRTGELEYRERYLADELFKKWKDENIASDQ